MSHDVLTVEKLLAIAGALGDMPPMPRIIVGFPIVGAMECVEYEPRRITLLGREAYEALKRHAGEEPQFDLQRDPFLLAFGVDVEFFEWGYCDHDALFREIASALAALKNEPADAPTPSGTEEPR